jgi:effector-binding domain-containing protein
VVRGALGELRAAVSAQDVVQTGPAAGIYADDLFAAEQGQATVFILYVGPLEAVGRVRPTVVPGAELATVTHHGPLAGIDLAHGAGALAAYVGRHELRVDGPIREYYTVAGTDTPDSSAWRIEVGLPIFSTRQR